MGRLAENARFRRSRDQGIAAGISLIARELLLARPEDDGRLLIDGRSQALERDAVLCRRRSRRARPGPGQGRRESPRHEAGGGKTEAMLQKDAARHGLSPTFSQARGASSHPAPPIRQEDGEKRSYRLRLSRPT